ASRYRTIEGHFQIMIRSLRDPGHVMAQGRINGHAALIQCCRSFRGGRWSGEASRVFGVFRDEFPAYFFLVAVGSDGEGPLQPLLGLASRDGLNKDACPVGVGS